MKFKYLILSSLILVLSLSSCSSATIEEVIITEPVTYDTDVSIIISNNCLPCHAGGFPAAGLNLEGYSNVRSSTENGNLLSSIFGFLHDLIFSSAHHCAWMAFL